MENINLSHPEDLLTTYTDPESGEKLVFRSTPPDDVYDFKRINEPVKKQLSRFLWIHIWLMKRLERREAVEGIAKILPILDCLVNKVEVKAFFSPETSEPVFEYTISVHEVFTDESGIERSNNPFTYLLLKMLSDSDSFKSAVSIVFEVTKDEVVDTANDIDTRKELPPISLNGGINKKSDLEMPPGSIHGNILMGIHTAKQFFGIQEQYNPEAAQAWNKKYGQSITANIDRYGADLTDIQHRVLEGIISAFTQSNYKGNMPAMSKDQIITDFNGSLPKVFNNVDEIPCTKIGRRELVRLAGLNDDSQADMLRVTEAVNYLASTTFCFYYNRLVVNSKNEPQRGKNGDWEKEVVVLFDTLIKLKVVFDESATEFKYYEINPSPIFLDQRSNYFLLIPRNWRDEVKSIIGSRKTSSYTLKFILYLRLQFELKRRHNNSPGNKKKVRYEIIANWRDIARELRIPESVYKDKKARALAIINDAYSAAEKLGYLVRYSRGTDELKDTLILNPAKYPDPKTDAPQLAV